MHSDASSANEGSRTGRGGIDTWRIDGDGIEDGATVGGE